MERDQPDDSDREFQPRRRVSDPPPAAVSITPVPTERAPAPRQVTRRQARRPTAPLPPVPPPERERVAKGPKPSKHVVRYLFPTEQYCGEWRRHWIYVFQWALLGAVAPLLAGYLVGLAGDSEALVNVVVFLWVAVSLFVAFKLIDWYHDRFVLTNKRVMVVHGIVSRKVGMMPLARVTDMAYNQTVLGRMLNYGTFVLESAGQDQALSEIKPLPHPNELYLLFCQQMYGDAGGPTGQKSLDDAEDYQSSNGGT